MFIQLRGETLSFLDINRDDVDLLGTPASIRVLLDAAYRWAAEGLCHIRISARNPNKTLLVLYSVDGEHTLTIDLWHKVSQLVGIPHSISMKDLEPLALPSETSVHRIPHTLETCLYIHHLASKKKDLSAPSVQTRLNNYLDICRDDAVLRTWLTKIIHDKQVDNEILNNTLEMLKKRAPAVCKRTFPTPFPFYLKSTGKGHFIAIMGCDGVGKTSLSEAAAKELRQPVRVMKGKHLYRKCYLFKIMVILIRPLLFQSREKFDEIMAFFVYPRACLSLRIKKIFTRNKLVVIDRSVIDFLFLNRKTDKPRWSLFKGLRLLAGSRIPTIHCIADFDIISNRKQEMTRNGHALYDESMFQHFAHRVPTEYVLFNNGSSLQQSKEALLKIIRGKDFPLASRHKIMKNQLQ